MKILQSLLYGLALAGPQQDDTEEMCGGVSRIRKKNFGMSVFEKNIIESRLQKSFGFRKKNQSKVNFRLQRHFEKALISKSIFIS